jgi:ferritin-like metal-binding protein YciE
LKEEVVTDEDLTKLAMAQVNKKAA